MRIKAQEFLVRIGEPLSELGRELLATLRHYEAEVSRLTAEVKRLRSAEADNEVLSRVNLKLTAEVERLRGIAEDYQVQAELFAGDGAHLDPTLAALRARLAALALPTPAPEATDG